MAVTVIERPIGRKVNASASVTIYNSAGKAGFTDSLSLNTGDYIYIQSNIEDYNGFWYVEESGGVTYFKQNPQDSRVSFVVEANATVYSTIQVDWSCVHLPIVYKLKSDFYPTNTNDPIVTLTPYGFINGYFAVQHSALTGSDALLELDYVSLNSGEQIIRVIEVVSTTITVLDSDGTGSFINMQRYRNNYHVIVNLYAGLNASHTWASKKPYELAATLKYIPDENNEVVFSVSEILKSYIEIRNNTLLGTLPNNIDFFTQFYITFQEAYDVSEFPYDVQVSVHETDPVNDQGNFEGVAANSILEFKNRYSGYLSEYVIDNNLSESKFLTLFETPTIFQDKYFDISYIRNYSSTLTVRKNWVDIDLNVIYTSDEALSNYSKGVYRIPLTIDHGCTFVNIHPAEYSPTTNYINSQFTTDMDGWNNPTPPADPWFWDDAPSIYIEYITRLQQTPQNTSLFHSVNIPAGTTIRIRTRFSWAVAGVYTFQVYSTADAPVRLIGSYSSTVLDIELIVDDTVTLPSDANVTEIFFRLDGGETPGNQGFVDYFMIDTVSTVVTPSYTTIDPLYLQLQILNGSNVLSESKLFKLDCTCVKQELYLTWLNNLGGFDYWNFTDGSDYTRNIIDSGETKTNIFPDWPKSYGENASVIRKQTFKTSNKGILVRSQHLTLDELQAIEYLKSSILVEIMLSRSDKRRVIVDTNSWVSYKDVDKLYTLSFTLEYTNDIPVQRL